MAKPPDNPLLARLARPVQKQSPAYRASRGLEKKLAKRTGGYITAGSGNKNEKGDVRVRGITRLEHKGTAKKSFSVTRDMLSKLQNAAMGCDEIPILVVDFLDEQGKSSGNEVAVIPMQELMDLLDAIATRKHNS